MTEKCRIRCKAKLGAFDQEMIVRIPIVDSSGTDVEAFSLAYQSGVTLHGQLARGHETDAELEAYCLGEQEGFVSVVLPQPTFQNGPSVIVRKANLV